MKTKHKGEVVHPHEFDDSFDEEWRYERFITTIQQKAGVSWEKAERAAGAALMTLSERISSGTARDIAEELPKKVRTWLLFAGGDGEAFGVDEFIRRVAEREEVDSDTAERHAHAVFIALARLVRSDEMDELLSELPREYAPLLGATVGMPESAPPEVVPYEEFIERVQGRAGLDPNTAERATRAVLQTLAERISAGEVEDLIEVLPGEFRPPLELGVTLTGGKAQRFSLDEFIARVARRAQISEEQAHDAARAVFATLREAVPQKELSDVVAQLPRGYVEALVLVAVSG